MFRNLPTEGTTVARLFLFVSALALLVVTLLYAGSTFAAAGPAGWKANGSEGLVSATATSTSAITSTATSTPIPPTGTPTTQSACMVGWSTVTRPGSDELVDVSIVDAHEIWAIGTPNALRWVAGTWTVQ